MRKLLILSVLCLISILGLAQNQNIDANSVLVRQYFRMPVWDTTTTPRFDLEWRIRPQNRVAYQFDITIASGPRWRPIVGSSTGVASLSNVGGGFQVFKGLNGTNAELRSIVAGWGVLGQTNTNDLTFRIDSFAVTSVYQHNKTRDSILAIVALKLNKSDTAAMLANYYKTPLGSVLQYIRGDGSLATFPNIPLQFNPIQGSNMILTGTYPNITFNSVGGSSGGTLTNFAMGDMGIIASPTVNNPTTNVSVTWSLKTVAAYSILGNNTGALTQPTYFVPILASPLFRNQGTTTTVLIGNGAGNPSWGLVNLLNMITGNLPIGNLNGGLNASPLTFWRGDGQWAIPPSSGGGGGSSGYFPVVDF